LEGSILSNLPSEARNLPFRPILQHREESQIEDENPVESTQPIDENRCMNWAKAMATMHLPFAPEQRIHLSGMGRLSNT
jgi:hypothetical protein